MAVRFLADGSQGIPIQTKNDAGYTCVIYSGTLGSGTLEFFTTIEGYTAAIPNSKLNAQTLDDNAQVIKMICFSTAGTLSVALTGSTNPDVYVCAQ